MLGAPQRDGGEVRIIYGPFTPGERLDAARAGMVLRANDRSAVAYGSRVGVVRDLDGDTVPDIAIGAASDQSEVRSTVTGAVLATITGRAPFDIWNDAADGGAGGGSRIGVVDVDLGCDCTAGCLCPPETSCFVLPDGRGVCVPDNVTICPSGPNDCDGICPTCTEPLCQLQVVGPQYEEVGGWASSPWGSTVMHFTVVPKWATVDSWSIPTGASRVVVLETTNQRLTLGIVHTGPVSVRAETMGCFVGETTFAITSPDDLDGDGVLNDCEVAMGSSPLNPADVPDLTADSDQDGLTDVHEVCVIGSSPTDFDTDGDGLPDAWEVESGTDALVDDASADPDDDGLGNLLEFLTGQDALIGDTDGDGIADGDEPFQSVFPTCAALTGESGLIDAVIVNAGTAFERVESPGGVSVCRGETVQFHSTEGLGAHLYTGTIVSGHAYVTDTGIGADSADCLSSIYATLPGVGDGTFEYIWMSYPPGGGEPCVGVIEVDVRDAMFIVSPDASDPGACLTLVNNHDTDGDAIPDFADGFDFAFDQANDDLSANDHVTEMTIAIPDLSSVDPAHIVFDYDVAHPSTIASYVGPDGPVYIAPSGSLRLWRTPANVARSIEHDLIVPGEAYEPADFGLTDTGGAMTVYVESVRVSSAIGDHEITVHAAGCIDVIGFTSISTGYAALESDYSLTTIDGPHVSMPSPVFSMSQFTLTDLRASVDGQRLVGDIVAVGTLDDAYCDLIEGPDGVISEIAVLVNGLPATIDGDGSAPVTIQIAPEDISKASTSSQLDRPNDFSASFSVALDNVNLDAGTNMVRLQARNARGLVGTVDLTVELSIESPPDAVFEVDVVFMPAADNGIDGVMTTTHSTTDLDGAPMVSTVTSVLSSLPANSNAFVDASMHTVFEGFIGLDGIPFDPLTSQSFLATISVPDANVEPRTLNFDRDVHGVCRAVYAVEA
ncbi:MAG: hypothetical protein AAF432_16635, partial [Planctomycetota bacterium]